MSPKKETINQLFDVVQNQGQQIFEVLEAVHVLAAQMEQSFGRVNDRFDALEGRFETLEGRVGRVESQMVTKTYLDDKLADLRGDLTLLTRKEDEKLLALVNLLYGKRLMTETERQHIMALQPFAAA